MRYKEFLRPSVLKRSLFEKGDRFYSDDEKYKHLGVVTLKELLVGSSFGYFYSLENSNLSIHERHLEIFFKKLEPKRIKARIGMSKFNIGDKVTFISTKDRDNTMALTVTKVFDRPMRGNYCKFKEIYYSVHEDMLTAIK